jgi:segregation and condensation protein A
MQRIYQRLHDEQQVAFSDMFDQQMHKSRMIGVFLAVLELVRHHSVDTRQDQLHGEIWIIPGGQFQQGDAFSDVDEYGGSALTSEDTSE